MTAIRFRPTWFIRPLGVVLGAMVGASTLAGQTPGPTEGELRHAVQFSGWLESEVRVFPHHGLYADQRTMYPALGGELRVTGAISGAHRWAVTGFGRGDLEDSRRSHIEIREATWTWQPASWQVRGGILTSFWGVTESNRLVDVVNQRDEREAPDIDAKLGQPGIAFTGPVAGGTLEVLGLTYHRPRPFGLGASRFRPPPTFVEEPLYESAAGRRRVDWAGRWSIRAGALDLGASHFWGTAREPSFHAAAPSQPRYAVINQQGLDAQLTLGALLLKAETVRREGDGPTFSAATTGAEYVLGDVASSGGDVVIFAELALDQRRNRTPTGLDRDLFLALRWNPNDAAGTELITAGTLDLTTGSHVVRLEGSRRWSASWRVVAEVHLIGGQHPSELGYMMRRDSFVRAAIARHF
jgi:hypothetical protein